MAVKTITVPDNRENGELKKHLSLGWKIIDIIITMDGFNYILSNRDIVNNELQKDNIPMGNSYIKTGQDKTVCDSLVEGFIITNPETNNNVKYYEDLHVFCFNPNKTHLSFGCEIIFFDENENKYIHGVYLDNEDGKIFICPSSNKQIIITVNSIEKIYMPLFSNMLISKNIPIAKNLSSTTDFRRQTVKYFVVRDDNNKYFTIFDNQNKLIYSNL